MKDVRVVLLDVSSLAVMAEEEALGKAPRLYINKADIRLFAAGKGAQRHSDGCRARLEPVSPSRTLGESA